MYGKTKEPCKVCTGEWPPITYKNPEFLATFLTERARIKPRKQTGLCAKHQRRLAREIKRARQLILLPYTTVTTKLTPQEIKEYFEQD